MIFDIECPKPAYDRLVESGLAKKILDNREKIQDLFLARSQDYDERAQEIFRDAEKKAFHRNGRLTDKVQLYKDLHTLDEELTTTEYDLDKEDLLMKFPSLLAFIVLHEEVLHPEKFGFISRRQLEESIASFCFGEKPIINGWESSYSWRSGNHKNTLSNGNHGDLFLSQIDVSGKAWKDLLDQEHLYTFKDTSKDTKIIPSNDTAWNEFLFTNLLYAQHLGMNTMYEIVNWQDVLKEVGSVGTITAEAMFGETNWKMSLDLLRESPLLINGQYLERLPLSISSSEICYFPYVSNRQLMYLKKDDEGEIIPFKKGHLAEERFSPHITYSEEDLPDLLKGTYRLFARDRRMLPRIMNMFLSEN